MDWSVDEDGVGPSFLKACGSLPASVGGTVVHDPEDTASGLVGFLRHHFADEAIHRSNSIFQFAAAEYLCAMDIPGRQIGPGTLAEVLVLDAGRPVRSSRQRRMLAVAGLDAGLFVCGNHIVINAQWDTVPGARVEIEDGTGFSGEVGIAREDPASMLPGTKGIGAEPPPQCRAADLRNQTLGNHVLTDLFHREPGQGEAEPMRKFAGERFNLNDQAGGKSGPFARAEVAPPDQAIESDRIAFAIY